MFKVLYHADCADGFGAAWAVRNGLYSRWLLAEFIPVKYGSEPPEFNQDDHVVIVDFSYSRAVLQQIAENAKRVLILDHHKTAAEDLADLPHPGSNFADFIFGDAALAAIFDMNRSGAMIAWEFFNPDQPAPWFIHHIQDRDLWRFEIEFTREVCAALFSIDHDFECWDKFCSDGFHSAVQAGTAILRNHQRIVESLVNTQHQIYCGGYKVPAVNAPMQFASDVGNELSKTAPFAVVYQDHEGLRKYSLRSQADGGIDVSAIAKNYGGGGHRNAAGFALELGQAHCFASFPRELPTHLFDFGVYCDDLRKWSDKVFGPGLRTAGVIDHITKELREVQETPADLEEWVDVMILAIDGASRAGYSGAEIIRKLQYKHGKNMARQWPDWRKADPDKAIEHVRA